jgi:hypothetical protein
MSLLSVIIFCFATSVSAQQAQEKLSTKTEAIPLVFQVAGRNEASLPPARYPQFSEFKSKFPDCESKLKSQSLQLRPEGGPYDEVSGLSLVVNVPEAYRKNSSILITWTMRVEGESKKVPISSLCHGWYGSVTETFKGGQVYTQAYVAYGDSKDFQPEGQELGMTLPDGDPIRVVVPPPSDPTHTGSYLLKPPSAGEFPSKIKVKIYWRNDTCMRIFSKAHYRSLIVTLIPPEKK